MTQTAQTQGNELLLIDQLPFGVVKDMMEFLIDLQEEPSSLLEKELIEQYAEKGAMVNYYNYFFTGDGASGKQFGLLLNLPVILTELVAQHAFDTEYWFVQVSEMIKESCKLGYVIVKKDHVVHLPNGTSFKIYEGDEYDFVNAFETDGGKFAVLYDDINEVLFVVNTSVLKLERHIEE